MKLSLFLHALKNTLALQITYFLAIRFRVRATPRCRTSGRTSFAALSNPSYPARPTSSGFRRRRRSASVPRRSGSRRCRYWRRRSRPRRWCRPKSAEVARRFKSGSGRTTSASRTARSRRTASSLPKTTARTRLGWRCPVGGTSRPTAFGHPIR